MRTSLLCLGMLLTGLLTLSFQTQPVPLTDAQKAAISDSATAVIREFFRKEQELSTDWINLYSTASDARYAEDGILSSALDSLRADSESSVALLESSTIVVDALDVVVLGPEAAAVMAPYHFTLKTKAGNATKGRAVFSAVVQRRANRWQIIHSHESHANIARIMRELFPPKPKQ